MDKKSTIALLINYIVTRPIILKIVDIILVLMVAFGIATAYIISINFEALFLTENIEIPMPGQGESNQINRILESLRNDFGGKRTRIFMFHGKYYSQTYDRTAAGVSSEMLNSQAIPTEIDDKLPMLIANNFQYDTNVLPTSQLGLLLQSQGILQYYRHIIYNLDGQVIGFVTIEYFTDVNVDVGQLHRELRRIADALSGALL